MIRSGLVDEVLNYCPRCGKQDIDPDRHGSQGIGLCRDCGTLFSILSVRMGNLTVPIVKVTHDPVLPVTEDTGSAIVPPKARG